jgi:starch synthase
VVVPGYRLPGKEPPTGEPIGEVHALLQRATLLSHPHQGTRVVFLDCPALFARPALYTLPDGDFPDNPMRFSFFARAALETVGKLGGADVVHAHDWQGALAPFLLRHDAGLKAWAGGPGSVLSIHNLAYQGVFPPWILDPCGLPAWAFNSSLLEFYGQVNFLKSGLVSCDAIATVSPTYAKEILTPLHGWSLQGVLASRVADLHGVLNGLDTTLWDPSSDPHLPAPYTADSVAEGKRAARSALAEELGLEDTEHPLLGMVSRLAEQKGADLVAADLDAIVDAGFDLVVLGTGERRFEEAMRGAEAAHPGRVRVVLRFDEPLSHRIYAASDLFLMPSRYEPCGLGQMIAMRYGTLPVVHRTGGLADTVVNADVPEGTGFVFDVLTPAALVGTLQWARQFLDDEAELARLRANAMAQDFSWAASARRYVEIYQGLVG